jgi:hypothetical protein
MKLAARWTCSAVVESRRPISGSGFVYFSG